MNRGEEEKKQIIPDQAKGVGRSGVRWTSDKGLVVALGGTVTGGSAYVEVLSWLGLGFFWPTDRGPQDWGLLDLDYSKAGW